MTTTQTKNRGFTLVELLIVIVIIAILTVISLIAYNGIQNRARKTTAESTAKSAADKIQIYYTDEGKYPDDLDALGGATVSVNKPYHIDKNSIKYTNTATDMTSQPSDPNTVAYKKCNKDGGQLFWWDYTAASGSEKQTRKLGDQTGC